MTTSTNLENEINVEWIVDGQILFMDVSVTVTDKMATYDQMIVDYLRVEHKSL